MGIENLEQRHDELGAWILNNTQFWQPRPFTEAPCSWENDFSDLAKELRGLSLDVIEAYESEPGGYPSAHTLYNTIKNKALELSECPKLGDTGTFTVKDRRGIKGKKLRQISAFASASHSSLAKSMARSIFDWCGGKGHLGRSLALEHKRSLTLLDIDETLLSAGGRLAAESGLPCETITIDALSPEASSSLGPGLAAVALHACGQLHMNLAKNTVSKKVPTLVMAPCCYHRITGDHYQALSERGRSHGLTLNRELLKLAT
ncbi:MAG: methyltransferase, partial [Planctomycetota bacterium]|nr:methyltransferase [Planctomycetota bacterium]